MFQIKEQDKTLEKGLNKVEIGDLLDQEFTVIIQRMLSETGRRMVDTVRISTVIKYRKEQNRAEQCNNWNKTYVRSNQQKINDTEEQINELEDRVREITQVEQKNILKKK